MLDDSMTPTLPFNATRPAHASAIDILMLPFSWMVERLWTVSPARDSDQQESSSWNGSINDFVLPANLPAWYIFVGSTNLFGPPLLCSLVGSSSQSFNRVLPFPFWSVKLPCLRPFY